jgi:uncharacterized protein YukE
MTQNQQFDFSRADELRGKLKGEITSITGRLNKTQKMIEEVREWWKGGSEELFIKSFEKTKKDIVKGLEKWLEGYQSLLKETAKIKEIQDAELRRVLSK